MRGLRFWLCVFCLGLVFSYTVGCSRNTSNTLSEADASELVAKKISTVEYQTFIDIGKRIGIKAEDPDSFLKELGIIDYIIRKEQDRTWYVVSSLTDKGRKLLKPVNTVWGKRYAVGIAKLKLDKVAAFQLNPDGNSAVIEVMLKLERSNNELAKHLDPEKSVAQNHNIHIECVDIKGNNEIPWGVPANRPYSLQLKRSAQGWKVEKLLKH